jgi:hypothetical protein
MNLKQAYIEIAKADHDSANRHYEGKYALIEPHLAAQYAEAISRIDHYQSFERQNGSIWHIGRNNTEGEVFEYASIAAAVDGPGICAFLGEWSTEDLDYWKAEYFQS